MPGGETTGAPSWLLTNPALLWVGSFASSGWVAAQGLQSAQLANAQRVTLEYPAPVVHGLRVTFAEDQSKSNSANGCAMRGHFAAMGMPGEVDEIYAAAFLRFHPGFAFHSVDTGNTHSVKLGPGVGHTWSPVGSGVAVPDGGNCSADSARGNNVRGFAVERSGSTTTGHPAAYIYAGGSKISSQGGTCISSDYGGTWRTNSAPYFVPSDLLHFVVNVRRNTTPGNKAGSRLRLYLRNITADGYGLPAQILEVNDFATFATSQMGDVGFNCYIAELFPGGSYKNTPGTVDYILPHLSSALIASEAPGGGDPGPPPPDPPPPDPDPLPPPDGAEDRRRFTGTRVGGDRHAGERFTGRRFVG